MTATRLAQHINAPRSKIYRAILDPLAVQQWMVPDGMRSNVHEFDAREGGVFRISLTYDAPTTTGKTSAQTDTFHGRFVRLVQDAEIVQVMEFETNDPTMKGEMTVSYVLTDENEGTLVTAVHDNLPSGLSGADNEIGWRMSLEKLAAIAKR